MKVYKIFFPGLLSALLCFFLLPGSGVFLYASGGSVRILFIGDSLSAGLGVEPEHAYPSLILEMLNQKGDEKQIHITNGSISGSTTAGAHSRLKWFLKVKPDILVLALGANDGLRGLSIKEMTQNLDKTIELAKENNIKIILAGMEVPPNYGPGYAGDFREAFSFLADKHEVSFFPFLLKGVAGNPLLNQADGIHPNRDGHRIIADTILPYILEQL